MRRKTIARAGRIKRSGRVRLFIQVTAGGIGRVYATRPAQVYFDDTECPPDFERPIHRREATVVTAARIEQLLRRAMAEHGQDKR